MRIKNKIGICLVTAMLCVGMFSTTAFAYVDESAVTEKETVTETKTDTEKEEKETEKTGNALTPEGNLTLVDDEGASSDTGKQFVTLVTKSGNYFYLIIDRDAEGNNTVHFLNQVDEEDLFALMEDDEVQKFQTELAEKEQNTEKEPEVIVPEEEPEPVKEKKETNMLPVVATLVLLLVGAGVYGFWKMKEKMKEEESTKPDPDADYHDEIEYEFVDENELPDRDEEEEDLEEEDLEEEEEL